MAGFSAALVLLLAALTASPAAHHWFHDSTSDNEDGCAVVVFALGVALVGAADLVLAPLARRRSEQHVGQELVLISPRYLHLPERGPPAQG